MEEVTALVSYCCNLAKDLDSNLEGLSNHHDVLLQQIEHIIYMFTSARDHLRSRNQHMRIDSSLQLPDQEIQEPLPGQIEIGGHGAVAAMLGLEVPSTAIIPGNAGTHMQHTGGAEASIRWWSNRPEAQPGGSTSASPRTRRRTDGEKRTVRVAAPQIGNTEIPPEDDYSWRKYGQKEILGARFPRAYYRCTYQKLYNCPAKKRVQRLDDDPSTFVIVYCGEHTCHMSSTASSSVLPPSTEAATSQHLTLAASAEPSRWFSMVDSGGAGPSDVHHGREADYHPVVDMADVMFNYGGSRSNSMELIFPSSASEPKDSKN